VLTTSGTDGTGTDQGRDAALEVIAGQYCRCRGEVAHEHGRFRQIAGEAVVADDQLLGGVLDALGADRDRGTRVAASGAFLHPVTPHNQVAAIRDIDKITRISVRPVGDVVVDQNGVQGTRLDVMAHVLIGEARAFYIQLVDPIHVNAVGADRIAPAVAAEFAVGDADRAAADRSGEDAILVVDEPAVLHGEIATLGTDAGAIAVGHPGTGKGQVADRNVAAQCDEDCLAATGFIGQHGARSGGFNGQSVGAPGGAIGVIACRNPDYVTWLGHGGGLARQGQMLARSDYQHAACTWFCRAGRQPSDKEAGRQTPPPASIIHAAHRTSQRNRRLYTGTIPAAQEDADTVQVGGDTW